MQRLTTDNPQDNMENALNMFFVKNKETWVRNYGPAPDYGDISLTNLVREIAKENDLEIAQSKDNDEINCEMADILCGTEELDDEVVVDLLYTAAWACAELRARLMAYEDTGLTPQEITEMKPKQGKWNGEGDGYANGEIVYDVWECNQCGHIIDDGTDDPKQLPNYCPNCGAKMGKGVDEK